MYVFSEQVGIFCFLIYLFAQLGGGIRIDDQTAMFRMCAVTLIAAKLALVGFVVAIVAGAQTVRDSGVDLFLLGSAFDFVVVGLMVIPAALMWMSQERGGIHIGGYASAVRIGLAFVLLGQILISGIDRGVPAPAGRPGSPAAAAARSGTQSVDPTFWIPQGEAYRNDFPAPAGGIPVRLEGDATRAAFVFLEFDPKGNPTGDTLELWDGRFEPAGLGSSRVTVVWSPAGTAAGLEVGDQVVAAFDAAGRVAYGLTGRPAASPGWTHPGWNRAALFDLFKGVAIATGPK